jgi:hypothetical protein
MHTPNHIQTAPPTARLTPTQAAPATPALQASPADGARDLYAELFAYLRSARLKKLIDHLRLQHRFQRAMDAWQNGRDTARPADLQKSSDPGKQAVAHRPDDSGQESPDITRATQTRQSASVAKQTQPGHEAPSPEQVRDAAAFAAAWLAKNPTHPTAQVVELHLRRIAPKWSKCSGEKGAQAEGGK